MSYDAGSGLDDDLDSSISYTNTLVPASPPLEAQPFANQLVNVIHQMGNLRVEHTFDADGCVCIDIPERIKAIATLAQVDTITQVSRGQTFTNVQVRAS